MARDAGSEGAVGRAEGREALKFEKGGVGNRYTGVD